jgi:hypothetical protein
MQNDIVCHEIVRIPSYWSNIFSTQIFQELLILVETVLSMLTLVTHFKKVMHRVSVYFETRLAFTMAAFNVLVQWQGLRPNASGFVPLSIAEFSL